MSVTGQACGGKMEGGKGRGRGEQGAMGMSIGRVSLLKLVFGFLRSGWLTVTLVTSLRRERIREATKTLL